MDQWMDGKPVGWIIPKTINLSPPFSFLKLNSGFANGTLGDEEEVDMIVIPFIGNYKKKKRKKK